MTQSYRTSLTGSQAVSQVRGTLEEIVHRGAEEMLRAALEAEVGEFLAKYESLRGEHGHRFVVRNGYLPEREILTGAGPLKVQQPRVRDLRGNSEDAVEFSSSILPRYLRRSKSVDELIPWLYLRGISTGDFQPALEALLGKEAKGLSANVVVQLKEKWSKEFEQWNRRDLSQKDYVYFWADGVYFNIRLEDDRQCILVLMAAAADGQKEVLAIQDGFRESEQSWSELLVDLKARGLKGPPQIAVGDGALGFWAALRKVFPLTREQRCWMHKMGNVLNKLPKSVQDRAKADLREIWQAATREQAYKAFDAFVEKYSSKYPKAVECLQKDREELLAFYDFPAEHWAHLRTTNPIESIFATVRLRQRRTKGSGTRRACLAMVFKLIEIASKNWRALKSPGLVLKVLQGTKFVDGIMDEKGAA